MSMQLELLNGLAARGRTEFTFDEAREALGVSTTATANALRRLSDNGLVDRLVRGHYAIRPIGSLATSAVSDDLSAAIGGAFSGYAHRIAYLSALSEIGVLTHPVRRVVVACTKQVRFSALGSRPLRVVVEKPETIHLGAESVGSSWRSSLERGLLEIALRVDLAGGVELLAEAVAAGAPDADGLRIASMAPMFGARGFAAERRLASLVDALELDLDVGPSVDRHQPVVRLDPRDDHVAWVDERFRVSWNRTVDEVRSVVGN